MAKFEILFQNFHTTIVVLCGLVSFVSGYNILFLTPFNGKSHWILMETIIESLLNRGHTVTTVTNFKWNGPKSSNYTEILIDPPLDFESYSKSHKLFFKFQGPPITHSVFNLHFIP